MYYVILLRYAVFAVFSLVLSIGVESDRIGSVEAVNTEYYLIFILKRSSFTSLSMRGWSMLV